MSKTVRTRFTTGCGHSWTRKHPKYTVERMSRGATSDCKECGALVYIVPEQFAGMRLDCFPAEVHMPLFHRWLNQQVASHPADGVGTGYMEFAAEDDGPVGEDGYPLVHCVIVTKEGTYEYTG